jgi:hypothetical protein
LAPGLGLASRLAPLQSMALLVKLRAEAPDLG